VGLSRITQEIYDLEVPHSIEGIRDSVHPLIYCPLGSPISPAIPFLKHVNFLGRPEIGKGAPLFVKKE